MTRRRLPVFIVISLAGCGSSHLGPRFGERYRAAFEQQAEHRQSEEPGALDSADAKRVLSRHRSGGKPAAGAGAAGAADTGIVDAAMNVAGAGASGGYGAAGNPNPIRLEAK